MASPRRLLVLAQLAFWACVGLCLAVTGGRLSHNHGFSVYGGRWTTILPWAVGISAAAALVWRAADDALSDEEDQALARCLQINVVLVVLILLTPDSIDQLFYVAHIVASVALFLFQAIVGLWLVLRRRSGAVYCSLSCCRSPAVSWPARPPGAMDRPLRPPASSCSSSLSARCS